jgi:hypothetical protein
MPIDQPRHHAGDRHMAKAAHPRVPRRRALTRAAFRALMAVTVLGLVPIAVTHPRLRPPRPVPATSVWSTIASPRHWAR